MIRVRAIATAETLWLVVGTALASEICIADLDGDGSTTQADLGILLAQFGGPPGEPSADLSPNGVIDQSDLGVLLANFGCAGCIPGAGMTPWNDLSIGLLTEATPPSFADLNGDGAVDVADELILLRKFTGPDAGYALDDENPFFVADPADLDQDFDIDFDDLLILHEQMTGPATAFRIDLWSALPPFGHPAQFQYRIDSSRYSITGYYVDPQFPHVQWHFNDYGAPYEFLNRVELVEPLAMWDPALIARMEDEGFEPDEIATLAAMSPDGMVAELLVGLVDLSGNHVTGELVATCNGVDRTMAGGATNFAVELRGVVLDGGQPLLIQVAKKCTECTVKIETRPVCVCRDCKFTFRATGTREGGTYAWQVVQGANKTDPDSGSGQEFPVTFVGQSTSRDDIKIRVTYTTPEGKTCKDEWKLTSVGADVERGPLPDLPTPLCGGGAAPRSVKVIGVNNVSFVALGTEANARVGVKGKVEGLKIKTTPNCEECCKLIKVGFVQNLTKVEAIGTYSDGGKTSIKPKEGESFPMLDTDPKDPSLYYILPKDDGKPVQGKKCGVAFPISISDSPGLKFRVCDGIPGHPPQKLTKITVVEEFKTWLVAECPGGSACLTCTHQMHWRIRYDVDVTNVDCTAGTATVTVNQACAENIGTPGNCDVADFKSTAKTTGVPANSGTTYDKTGFGPP